MLLFTRGNYHEKTITLIPTNDGSSIGFSLKGSKGHLRISGIEVTYK